ncbi:MAG: hypothetical protein PHU80_07995 [Kiritimatiellae bacterium]|nr:hypothetical protein [Kiritimatiellia bacterium]
MKHYLLLPGFLLSAVALFAATPQEDAFMRAWSVHARNPADHKAVIDACQGVMDRASTLGEFLPVIKTIAAWHLLANGNQSDGIRIFESALVADKGARPLIRYSDTMARRWLTRLDHAQVEKALKAYYADHVEYPGSLSQLSVLTKDKQPPVSDRFGDPWVYEPAAFSRLRNIANQRYRIYSKSLGNRLTPLSALPLNAYGSKSASIVSRKQTNPVSVEFETVTEAGARRGVATESGIVNGIRFLRLSSDAGFAIMIDSDCDFWIVATPARNRQ